MSALDAKRLNRALDTATLATLEDLEIFTTIPSTNTHLLAKAPPPPGRASWTRSMPLPPKSSRS